MSNYPRIEYFNFYRSERDRDDINKKYFDLLNFIEGIINSKIEFTKEEMVIRNLNDFSQLLIYLVKNFFSLYFELDTSKREILIDKISIILIKLKRIEIVNIILSFLQFINELKHAIRFDYSKSDDPEFEFDYEDDLKIEAEDARFEETTDIKDPKDIFKLTLNVFNHNVEKNTYIQKVVHKVLKFNETSNYFNYNLISSDKNKNIIEITKKSNFLKLKEVKIKYFLFTKFYSNSNAEEPSQSCTIKEFSKFYRNSLLFLEKDIATHIKFTKRKTSNFKKAFEDFKTFLTQNLKIDSSDNKSYHYVESIKSILPFGSVTQFSYNIKSDLEITIITNDTRDQENFALEIFKRIEKTIQNSTTLYSKFESRVTKRTRLLNFYDIGNNTKVELMLNNYLGVLNSYLIRSYSLCDSRCIILINIIKDWSKLKKINGNFDGFMSSYCYTLMVIYFLQNLKKPILPVLQTNEFSKFCENEIKLGNFHFYLNFDDDRDDLSLCMNRIFKNSHTISEILLQFFLFYLHLFDENEYCIDISNRHTVYRYNQIKYLNYYNNKHFVYCFIDPFDYSYNPGSYFIKNSYQEEKFRKELENAIRNILECRSIFE
jgi:hypothetical protein